MSLFSHIPIINYMNLMEGWGSMTKHEAYTNLFYVDNQSCCEFNVDF